VADATAATGRMVSFKPLIATGFPLYYCLIYFHMKYPFSQIVSFAFAILKIIFQWRLFLIQSQPNPTVTGIIMPCL